MSPDTDSDFPSASTVIAATVPDGRYLPWTAESIPVVIPSMANPPATPPAAAPMGPPTRNPPAPPATTPTVREELFIALSPPLVSPQAQWMPPLT